ncbi:hypothetical protein CXG81DRAFT_19727 [Caulochytrium protostelioides]|uniref:Uncharacterized protein n=1 Tax=Caulochytrium protostelioides TaxID=1555241 RepID=A0A4P9X5A1_9FUNG|nr:hypothetical protein CXG81DRAFT_19727 [Caulochytrium protostelioides]|eukprot:RKP00296.1 hypothetical protein CXG81DRAFT_19727 [Caulochytrium protostelioides]
MAAMRWRCCDAPRDGDSLRSAAMAAGAPFSRFISRFSQPDRRLSAVTGAWTAAGDAGPWQAGRHLRSARPHLRAALVSSAPLRARGDPTRSILEKWRSARRATDNISPGRGPSGPPQIYPPPRAWRSAQATGRGRAIDGKRHDGPSSPAQARVTLLSPRSDKRQTSEGSAGPGNMKHAIAETD